MRLKKLWWLTMIVALLALASSVAARSNPAPSFDVASEISTATDKAGEPYIEGRYFIQLEDAPIASYRGGTARLAATSPSATGDAKLDMGSPAVEAYSAYLAEKQGALIASLNSLTRSEVVVHFQYEVAYNGISVELDASQLDQVAKLPGVRNIQKVFIRHTQTDYGPQWMGADGIWDGSATGTATKGEGMVVGIIDTGINMDHPSFADVGGDGYDHTNPLGAGNYLGWCNPADENYDPAAVCNDKLIGAYGFASGTPEDEDGHGSHTASTTAGNYLVEGTVAIGEGAGAYDYSPAISGVAPHANIIAYDGCDGNGCALDALIASIDQAAADGVDVINYSIGGGTSNPYVDADALAFLAAMDAGTIPVTSASNDGPGAATIGSPADAPWMFTVGASTHSRTGSNAITNMSGGDSAPPADIGGASVSPGYGPASIVYAGDFTNPNDPGGDPAQCLQPFPAGTFSGQIVVCDRGAIARVEKGYNVLQGGAGGYVLANVNPDDSEVGDVHHLPGIHITAAEGDELKAWLASGTGHMATLQGTSVEVADENGDIMAGFSSRGPNVQGDVIKPDVTAPGVSILAAYYTGVTGPANTSVEYAFISGTSMSSPHTAGAATLMADLYPDWSPSEIRSAIMMTTDNTWTRKEDGTTIADPFDRGSGSVRVNTAAMSGLVMDETAANFEAANPELGGNAADLNLASFQNGGCIESCSWTRTVESTMAGEFTWTAANTSRGGMSVTVDPPMFTTSGVGDTATFTVTVDATGLAMDEFSFGEVTLTPSVPARGGAMPPAVHFPIAVQPVAAILPGLVQIPTTSTMGDYVIRDNVAGEITNMQLATHGLVEATLDAQMLPQDSDNSSPYDDITDGAYAITAFVPAGSMRLVAEITSSTAPDIDLFVGTGSTPSEATELCASTTASWDEYCNISGDALASGTYWILVQNWSASSAPADDVTLAYGIVQPADAGNMTAAGPVAVAAGAPFDIDLGWNEPAMEVGDRWYGAVSLGSDVGETNDVGVIDVDIHMLPEEVLEVGGAPVTFDLGVPSDWAIASNVDDGMVWEPNGTGRCAAEFADLFTNPQDNITGRSGSALCVNSDGNQGALYDTELWTPSINLDVADMCSTVSLDFWVVYKHLNSDLFDVDVSTDGGATWTNVSSWAEDHPSVGYTGGDYTAGGENASIDLSAYMGEADVHARFRYYNSVSAAPWDWFAYVDDVSVGCTQVPEMMTDMDMVSMTVPMDSSSTMTMTISNVGTGDLEWSVYEDGGAAPTTLGAREVIWDQVDAGATGGAASDFVTSFNAGGYSADDFILNGLTNIESIFAPGFVNNQDLDAATSISWYILPDGGGMPGAAPGSGSEVWTHTSTPTGAGVDITDDSITLDLVAAGVDTALPGGRYWLSVVPTFPTASSISDIWVWYYGVADTENEAHLYNDGLFNPPPDVGTWGSFSSIGLTNAVGFRIEGTVQSTGPCGAENDVAWLSASPTSGTVAPGMSQGMGVHVDATGLEVGTHEASLCMLTNEPDAGRALVIIPVQIMVTDRVSVGLSDADVANASALPAIALTVMLGLTGAALLRRRTD